MYYLNKLNREMHYSVNELDENYFIKINNKDKLSFGVTYINHKNNTYNLGVMYNLHSNDNVCLQRKSKIKMHLSEEDIKSFNEIMHKLGDTYNNILSIINSQDSFFKDLIRVSINKAKIMNSVILIDDDLLKTQLDECWDILSADKFHFNYFTKVNIIE